MLLQDEAIRCLLEASVLDRREVVRHRVTCVDLSRRQTVYRIDVDGKPRFIIKYADDPEKSASLKNEARIYGYLNAAGLPFAARLVHDDPDLPLIVLAVVRDAVPLIEYVGKRRKPSSLQSRSLGKNLAMLHTLPVPRLATGDSHQLPDEGAPLILSFDCPPFDILEAQASTPANLELMRIVQSRPEFAEAFAFLRSSWTTGSLVHGDLKWDNCLARPARQGTSRLTRTVFVDWEFSGPGDREWDVATVLSQYLTTWIHSMPISHELSSEQSRGLAAIPLDVMRPSIRSFWDAYRRSSRDDDILRTRRLMFMVAARLVQSAYERQQDQGQLLAVPVTLLQLSSNILRRPEEAAVGLLGLASR